MFGSEKNAVEETDVASAKGKIDLLPLLKRFRIHLLIAVVLAGLLLALMAGLGLGRAKLAMERKQFVEQSALLTQKLTSLEREKTLLETKETALKQQLETQMSRVADLELELKEHAIALQKAEQASSPMEAEPRPRLVVAPVQEPKRYMRFGNVDCTVKAGSGEGDWKACLQQGKPGPALTQAPSATRSMADGGAGKQRAH